MATWMFTSRQTCCPTTSKTPPFQFVIINIIYCREYEFPIHRLKLGKLLGSGAFGRVLKAEASGILSSEAVSTVAVKMVKPQADITYMKALMAELKIMIHIGKHLNIVNLLGASTVRLNRRELLVIVEYCRCDHHDRVESQSVNCIALHQVWKYPEVSDPPQEQVHQPGGSQHRHHQLSYRARLAGSQLGRGGD